ncbi:MAG: hypothetical protein JST92_00685, partial [Deltaproteobacteria bacterium]|nr:hypothetical protein [Deltaproteobacteria bacterium]
RGYFFDTRNVGLIVRGGLLPKQLEGFFNGLWASEFAEVVDPAKAYEAPKTH